MESKKINQLATELAPDLSDLTIIGDPTTGISKKITLSQMASLFTGTVEEYANFAAFPITGVADTIYVAKDTNVIYRWDSTAYVVLSPNIIASLVFNDANGFDGTISLVGSVATLTITTALTSGSVPFIGASGALTQDNSNLFFDDTNNRLGIATASPTTALDVFGSGIIGRINATSTNNSFLGFASNGTNKWSAGNVQSDHRFRIFSEANSAELITILQTGEFGIGIANPTTKFHIDGAASALIANLDANVSIAKSVSYRSDNSARINLEVSGTESGSNAGADFFLRTFTDAGSLIETPFTIVRSTGVTTIKSLTLTNVLSVANGGTGSATQNFVDLTTTQSIGGAKTFTSALAGTSAAFSGNMAIGGSTITDSNMLNVIGNQSSVNIGVVLNNTNLTHARIYALQNVNGNFNIRDYTASSDRLSISSTGAATFSNSVGTTALNMNNMASLGSISGGSIYLPSTAIINFRSANGITSYGEISADTSSNIILKNNVGIGMTPDVNLQVKAISGNTTTFRIGPSASGFELSQDNGGFTVCTIKNIYGSTSASAELALKSGFLTFYSGTSLAERMRITSEGYVLIGATTSSGIGVSRFQLAGTSTTGQILVTNTSGGYASTYSTSSDVYMGRIDNGSSTLYIGTGPLNGSSFNEQMKISPSGVVTITNIGSGAVTATSGVLSATSDMNLKISDGYIDTALDKILKLTPRYFYWKEESGLPTDLRQLGFYAQEVNEAIGEEGANTPKTENDKWGIYDRAIIAMLTKAIQEQQAQIEELKAKIL
jgi:hypothetical protein